MLVSSGAAIQLAGGAEATTAEVKRRATVVPMSRKSLAIVTFPDAQGGSYLTLRTILRIG